MGSDQRIARRVRQAKMDTPDPTGAAAADHVNISRRERADAAEFRCKKRSVAYAPEMLPRIGPLKAAKIRQPHIARSSGRPDRPQQASVSLSIEEQRSAFRAVSPQIALFRYFSPNLAHVEPSAACHRPRCLTSVPPNSRSGTVDLRR